MPSGENSIPNDGRGRPRGALNIIHSELKEFWHKFFASEEYRQNAMKRIREGSAPHLESYLLNRIYGKPTEHVSLSMTMNEDLSGLSTSELALRAEDLLKQLREAEEIERVLPAQYRVSAIAPLGPEAQSAVVDVEPVIDSDANACDDSA